MRLIFLVETKSSKADSDYVYIKYLINHFYNIRSACTIRAVYMNGKTNYSKRNIQREIDVQKNEEAKSQKKDRSTHVFLCVDLDGTRNGLNENTNKALNKRIEKYCSDMNYHFVYFKEDIEEVFIGRKIPNRDKTSTAICYKSDNFDERVFRSRQYENAKRYTSNILNELDEVLDFCRI